jgi:hypothetical protein
MRKGDHSMKKLGITLFALVLVAMLPALGVAKSHAYKAELSGGAVVPEVTTTAKGAAEFEATMGGKELKYKLTVEGIENVTAAHIHIGKKGKNGPPVAGLFAGPKKEGTFSGTLGEGTITDKDLVGPLAGKTVKDLIKALRSGELYVNVHTDKYPDGELRGQIK